MEAVIAPVRTRRLAETIAEHLEGLILEGVLRPGEKLAAERDLADLLEVSRPSLREALQLLEERGLVATGKGGTVVAQFMAPLTDPLAVLLQSNARVADDYFEYREAIDGKAAALAAHRATSPDRDALQACLARLEAAHAAQDSNKEAEGDLDLHRLIYEASHNLVILHVMRAFADMMRRDLFFNRRMFFAHPEIRTALLTQHQAIIAAILAGDALQAEQQARAHVAYTFRALEALRQDEQRVGVALRRLGRGGLVVE